MSFVGSNCHLHSVTVIAVMYAISCYNGLVYNGTRHYHSGWTPFRFYVRTWVFHDVSLMYDKCPSGICLMYDKCSSGICLMYEPIRTLSGVFVHRVERSSHCDYNCKVWLDTLRASDAIWHHRTWSTMVQVMACPLFTATPLPEPMLTYCQSSPGIGTNFDEVWIKLR